MLPIVLQSLVRFCEWRSMIEDGGKPTKKPDQSTLQERQCRLWEQVEQVPRTPTSGIGIVTTGGIPVPGGFALCLDLDACRDPTTGDVAPWAREVFDKSGRSYTVISPSGTGLHVWIAVNRIPIDLRAMARVSYEAMPNTGGKTPNLQVIGLGPAGYVTLSLQPIDGTMDQIKMVDSAFLRWLVDTFELSAATGALAKLTMPAGSGPEPTLDEIEKAVHASADGTALIYGLWKQVVGEGKSASDAYFRLVQIALRAARGHGAATVQFLLQRTAWGRGQIDDSKDPGKYARAAWVWRDVARAAGKTNAAVQPSDVFEPIIVDEEPRTEVSGRDEIKLVSGYDLEQEGAGTTYLWEQLLPEGALAVWFGKPKCGKSYLALGLGLAIADGQPFLGRRTRAPGREKEPRLVVYVAGEGTGGIRDRMRAVLGVDRMRDPADPIHKTFVILRGMPQLTNTDARRKVVMAILALGVPPAFVIVDTVARAFGSAGLSENKTEEMSLMVQALDDLKRCLGRAAVLGNHHAGKSGESRGSTALEGAADVFCRIERVRKNVSRFEVQAMREGEPPEPIEVTFAAVEVAKDEFDRPVAPWRVQAHAEAVHEHPGEAEALEEMAAAQTDVERIVALLHKHGPMSVGDLMAEMAISRNTLKRRLDEAVVSGLVGRIGVGRATTYRDMAHGLEHLLS